MRKFLALIVTLTFVIPAMGQQAAFWLEGTVHGYEYNGSRGLLKKAKQAVFEGTLEDAQIRVHLDGVLLEQLLTNDKGNYSIPLEFNKLYTLTVTKAGYNKNTLLIDTRALPQQVQKGGFRFLAAEFVLNSYKTGRDEKLSRSFGRLHYNATRGQFVLAQGNVPTYGNVGDDSIELLERAIDRNNERLKHYEPEVSPQPTSAKARQHATGTKPVQPGAAADSARGPRKPSSLTISKRLDLGPAFRRNAADTSIIASKELALQRAREQLAMDKLLQQTKLDSVEIQKREAQILAAEQEIQHARLQINTQQARLDAQRNSLMLLVLLLIMLIGFLYLGYNFYLNKQQNSLVLEQKNKQITDSINYAQRIQQSILVGERTLKRYLPDSFVLSEPRDIVSGDFYFFHPTPAGFIIAVADCTGHGVPGAFMSLIGHRLLREIVAEKGITDPAEVLDQLDAQVQNALQGEKEGDILQDGMDIAVCLVEPLNRTITFAAAMNPAYLIQGSELKVLPADINSVGGKILRSLRQRQFTTKALTYTSGDMLYLFSDGFMDQFGAELDQKFNTKRFKAMLMEIQRLTASEQKEIAYKSLQAWKGNIRQTDDILLMGIRLP
jgi:serine phosphatase RsbU (regulator of sigma subunit)